MALTATSVTRFWDVWEVRLLVLLSLTLQIILSLLGNRRKYVSSLCITTLVWLSYLMADWAATFALSKLSNAQVNRDNRNALWVIWAPLLLLHLGAPDAITAYSWEDNKLWMRHLFGIVVQTSVAIYVVVMSWKHSWFSMLSIPALMAGFIKYGERVMVLMSVSNNKSREILPVGYGHGDPEGSNLDNNNRQEDMRVIYIAQEDENIRVLYIAHEYLEKFIETCMQLYDLRYIEFVTSSRDHLNVDEIGPFWDAIEDEMGLMFDLLHTKAAIKFRKKGLVLRCISFACTVTVLIGLICRFFLTRADQEQWKEVDAVITVVLLVGAIALEIYAVIASYLFSDWAMLWLLKQNIGTQVILQLRKKIPCLFRAKRYKCRKVGQFDLLDFIHKGFEPHRWGRGRILWSLLTIDRFKGLFDNNLNQDPTTLHQDPTTLPYIDAMRSGNIDAMKSTNNILWLLYYIPVTRQIVDLHIATEILWYNSIVQGDTCDDASSSYSSWEKNRNMCRTLSRYMMYLFITRSSLLPFAQWGDNHLEQLIKEFQPHIRRAQNVMEACLILEAREGYSTVTGEIVAHCKEIADRELRWEALKMVWVRMLCDAASKGQTNEHLGQLSQGGEFLTFLWFFLPQSQMLEYSPESQDD
ncbi:hypothetical protein Vadar_024742 [Vaccinium darrowii]|uniref:Uncharacterized protein n=1 Tax=Vaccinium darrowii TaxID=229202 RepID=A0ACB7ZLL1_9ERIC|nr:hypothetical protein Vadar_024742 [Vaccinium darrowii]